MAYLIDFPQTCRTQKFYYTQTWFKEEPNKIKFLNEDQVSAIKSKDARPSLRCCGVGCGAGFAAGSGAARDVFLGVAVALTALVFAAVCFFFEAWGNCFSFSTFLSKSVDDLDLLTGINFKELCAGAFASCS